MSNRHDVVVDDNYSTYIVNKGDHVTRVHGDAAIEITGYALAVEIAGSVDGGDKAGFLATTKPADYIPSTEDEANGVQGTYENGYSVVILNHGATISGSVGISATVSADDRDVTNSHAGSNDVELHNHGTITGTAGAALISDDDSYFYVVDNQSDGVINGIDATVEVLNNAGLIDGGKGSAIAGTIDYDSTNSGTITASGSGATVATYISLDNSGTIEATGSGSALLSGYVTNEAGGIISAAHGAAIDASDDEINLFNSGEVDGNVIGGNNPSFGSVVDQSGGGVIKGDVLLGPGDDRFVGMVDAAGHFSTGVTGMIDGGDGSEDTMAVIAADGARFAVPTLATGFEQFEVDTVADGVATIIGHTNEKLVLGGEGKTVFDGATGNTVSVFGGYSEDVISVAFENDGMIKSKDLSNDAVTGFDLEDVYGNSSVTSFVNKGTIEAGGTAVFIGSASEEKFAFDNENKITAHAGTAVDLGIAGTEADTVVNNGDVVALAGAALDVHADQNAYPHAAILQVVNHGSLTGTSGAILDGGYLTNDGSITATQGIALSDNTEFYEFANVHNSGSIKSAAVGVLAGGGMLLTNDAHATIEAAIAIRADPFEYRSQNIAIHNAGTIHGSIDLSASALSNYPGDHVINSGLIDGAVIFSDNSDVFDSRLGTTNGLISGNGGDDLIRGGDNHTLADGGAGNDRIYGDGGDDRVSGGYDNDQVYGGTGNDRVDGGAGADIVSGGDGNDVIIGGQGQDQLYGGAGSNNFVFQTASDSPAAGWVYGDRIEDWHAGDHIDLHQIDAIDPQHATGTDHAFKFVGTQAFDGGSGELRFAYAGANTIVYADLDGDKHADFGFALKGHVDLHTTDFVL